MYLSTARTFNGKSLSHLAVDVTNVDDPAMRICIRLDVVNTIYMSLDDAKLLHTRLDLALREAYDDIEVRDESAI